MAYITLPVAEELGREFPGIVGPMTFRPETTAPIYVDGLNTWAPLDMDIYRANAAQIVARGYSAVTDSATAHATRGR